MEKSKLTNLAIMQITVALLLGAFFLLLNQVVSTSLAAPSKLLFAAPSGSGYECSQIQPCSLQTALNQTDSGATLYLAQGTYTGSGAAVMMLDHDLSVFGGWNGVSTGSPILDPVAFPTILDAEDQRRGVQVDGGANILLDGFTVTRGQHDVKGAGLFASDATLNLHQLIFSGNVISATLEGRPFGGGATIEGGSVVISDSVFLKNAVKGRQQPRGGALVISNTVTAEVIKSRFQDNDAWVASGLYFRGFGFLPNSNT